jgi:hypothetical protein
MEYIQVLLPSIGVGLIFWYVMRGILRSDTTEREEMERYYRQLDDEAPAEEPASGDDEEKSAHGPRDESRTD